MSFLDTIKHLFDKKEDEDTVVEDDETKEMNDFYRMQTVTYNIAQTLTDFCKKYQLSKISVDFDILDISNTIIKEGENLPHESDETLLLDSKVTIEQKYTIVGKKFHLDRDVELLINIATDKYHTKAIAVVKKDSTINSNADYLKETILEELNRRKAKAGILLNLFDKSLKDDVNSMLEHIEKNARLMENFKITLCEFPEFTDSQNDKIIYHLKNNEKVDKDTILITYMKSVNGKAGRNFKGKPLIPKEPEIKNKPIFEITDNIKKVETDEKIDFISNIDGYISLTKDKLDIQDEVNSEVEVEDNILESQTITDKNIVIDILGSNNTITSSNTIEIKEIQGYNNTLIINPKENLETKKIINTLLKKNIILNKKIKASKDKTIIQTLKDEKEIVVKKLLKIEAQIKEKISIKYSGEWTEDNTIIFHSVLKNIEYKYITKLDETIEEFNYTIIKDLNK